MALDPIGVIFMAKDLASSTVKKLEDNFSALDDKTGAVAKSFKANMKIIGTGMSAMAVGAGILAPLGLATAKAADLQEELLNVRKIAGDKVNIDLLADQLNELAPALGSNSIELAKLAKGAATLQVEGNDNFIAFVDGISKMATALDMSTDQASTVGAKLLKVFEIPVSQIQNLGSAFNEMANFTGESASSIVDAVFRSSGALKTLGLSVGDISAMSARLIELGLSGDEAGTSLTRAFSSVAAQPEKLSKVMGITVAQLQEQLNKDAMGTITGFADKLAKMPNQAKALGIASEIFGEMGAKAILRLGSDTERLATMTAMANKGFADGTSLQIEFNSITEGFNFIMKQVSATIDSFISMMGKGLLPILSKVAGFFRDILGGVIKLTRPFAGFISKVMLFAGSLIFLTGAGVALIGMFKILTLIMAPLWIAMLPVLKLVLVLAAAFGLFYTMYRRNFGGFADFVNDVFNKVYLFFRTMFDVIANGEISEALYKQLEEAGILGFVEGVLNAFYKVKAFLGGLWEGLVAGFTRFEPVFLRLWDSFKILGGALAELFGTIMEGWSNLLGGGENGTKALTNMANIGRFLGGVLGTLLGIITSVVSGLTIVITLLVTGLVRVLTTVVSLFKGIAEVIGGIIGKITNLLSNSAFGKIVGKVLGVSFGTNAQDMQNSNVLPFPGPDARNQSKIQPVSPMFSVPNAGLDMTSLATQANVQAINGAGMMTAGAVENASSQGKEIVIVNKTILDGRQVAESVNRQNNKKRLAAGGQD